ncbi:hypothetical protein X943_000427 [Babesia divergens]|uniref:Uncharacterized protein n=1 Tax=Babesia divergens TaxID=32595 RepID=A0AAD9GJL3_BABDI|nr:hypothetical protein X943_000427 [Babesia divergens]
MAFFLAKKLTNLALNGMVDKDMPKNTNGFEGEKSVSDEDVENYSTTVKRKIHWQDLNYPWGLNLVHYDHRELNAISSKVSRFAHAATFVVYATLLLNLIDVTVLASMGISPIRILYSFFNVLLISPFVCTNFYLAFVVLALKGRTYYNQYIACQTIMCFLYIILAVLGEGPVNGFTKFMYFGSETSILPRGASIFWSVVIAVESISHLFSFFFGGLLH